MRHIRYQVAASLDGFIADQDGGFDWIPEEPYFDFPALFAQFDTLLVGRRTFEQLGNLPEQFSDKELIVFSRTLRQEDYPDVRVAGGELDAIIQELKARPGKDIWLYGGGELFRSLLELGHVDTVEIALMPVLLGGGLRLLPESKGPWQLVLEREQRYPQSGMVLLEYRVDNKLTD